MLLNVVALLFEDLMHIYLKLLSRFVKEAARRTQ